MNFVPRAAPRGDLNGMREKRAAPVGRVARAEGDARGEGDERGVEGVGQEHGQIEAARAPLARLAQEGERAAPLAFGDEQVVDEVGAREDAFGPRARRQRDARRGQHAPQLAQRRHGHHRVADPVRAAHDDAPDALRL